MKDLLSYWQWNTPGIIIVLLMIATRYLLAGWSARGLSYFIASLLVGVLSFFSPLAVVSGHYLFSAHMAVHVLLLLIAGPLLVMSIPAEKTSFKNFFTGLQRRPVAGWMAGVGIMWIWHLPVVFNTAMAAANRHPIIHVVEAGSLLAAGILFSAPVIHPHHQFRIEPLTGVLYLFTACIGCSLLGLLITFAPAGTYHHYQHGHGALAAWLQQNLSVNQAADQQAAGLIMWVPCCLVYVSGAMYLLWGWLSAGKSLPIQLNKT